MVIADRPAKVILKSLLWAASRFVKAGLLIFFVLFSLAFPQTESKPKELVQAQIEFDNGNYQKAAVIAEEGIEKSTKLKNNLLVLEWLNLLAISQVSLGKFDAASKTLNASLKAALDKADADQIAHVYMVMAWMMRAQRKSSEALEYAKTAVAAAPDNQQILAEYYLCVGRILYSSGFDISAIIWLEKAEKLLENQKTNGVKIDVYRFLTLSWYSKLNYQIALKYAAKGVAISERSPFKYKHRQALFDKATVLSQSGQTTQAFSVLEKGLNLSDDENDSYQGGKFLTSLLLNYLDKGNTQKAEIYLNQLEKSDRKDEFSFEIKLGRAVISALNGQREDSERLFAELEKQENTSDYILPYWKIAISERNKDWKQVVESNQKLLDLVLRDNFRDDLPTIYLNFAKAYLYLDQLDKSAENLEKILALAEEIRKSDDRNLSLGILETFHDAYRLLSQIKSNDPQESFELADFLKGRLLKDRINNAASKFEAGVTPTLRKALEDLSVKYINDNSFSSEIQKNERLFTTKIPELDLQKPDLAELDNIPNLKDSAIVSYLFTLDKKLIAFVWESGKKIRKIELPIIETEAENIATKTLNDIKNRVFFKRDGKLIYDKLVKPLNLSSKHIIFVPDKALWKIPFQALSSDGEVYLIEEKLVSYAPSVSILLQQQKEAKPNRQTLQAFANSSFETKLLQYVNLEASNVSGIYNSKPIISASIEDFKRISEKFDILHFSMHAEVTNDQPLDSFLGFRKIGTDDGRLTVENLLQFKLKKGSLVFLASCETNNVLNGEGLVSLSWAMLGSGATTVISSQWEANDKSTTIFTKTFYKHYKQGSSSAESLQKAALELIRNKSGNMHEPYYWADFTLNGDFR